MTSQGRWPKVAELREKLNGKAKAEPNFRFYLLHDKMVRKDVLEAAYAQCRQNDGAPGVDGITFERIEVHGVDGFLDELAHELKAETYAANAVKRVLIPKAGTPQGGVISPLLANIYFRRVLRAWEEHGHERRLNARIVNYADDFVILTRNKAREALDQVGGILRKIGLTLNERKTRVCKSPEEEFSFLGFTFGRQYTMEGQAYVGMTVADAKVEQHREKLRAMTGSDQTCLAAETLVGNLNRTIRGFWNYFSIGTQAQARTQMEKYTYDRMKSWMKRKHPKGGTWRERLSEVWPEIRALFKPSPRPKPKR
jgi:hypothetical protein